jgi:hypothetical protein
MSNHAEAKASKPEGARLTESEDGSALRWRSVEDAAAFLGMPVRVLRQTIASKARTADGRIEAHLDGIIARKLGRRWRVWLSAQWTAPKPPDRAAARRARLPMTVSAGHGGKDFHHDST